MRTRAEQAPLVLYESPETWAEQDCACGNEARAPVGFFSTTREQTESDCACPSVGIAQTTVLPTDSVTHWQRSPNLHRTLLSEAHEVVFNPANPGGIAVLNLPARRLLDSFAKPITFSQVVRNLHGMHRSRMHDSLQDFASLNLIQPTRSTLAFSIDPSARQLSTLSAWLHITNACNLDCSYCYLHKTDKAMDDATGKAAVDAVFRSALAHGFSAVKLKYAGGEPTMKFNLVRALHHHAQALAANTGLRLSEVLLTNGTAWTPAIIGFVRDAAMVLCVSLDGLGAVHDAQRYSRDGQGSSTLVEEGIDQALVHGVRPHLSVTITDRNVDELTDVVNFALDRDLLFNLNFYRVRDSKTVHDVLKMEDSRLIAGMQRALEAIESRLPRHFLISGLVDRADFSVAHAYPCGVGRSYLVVDEQGQIARCQMDIRNTVTTVYETDPLAVLRQSEGFRIHRVEEKEGCRECSWRYWCAGGCPLLAYLVIGRYDRGSPYCRVYQALYPQIVRLEGLRLLKYH